MFRNSKVTTQLIKLDGTKETVTIYEWNRGEYKYYYKRADGSWITPYEFKLRYKYEEGFGGLNTLFKVVYQEHIENIIPQCNPFLKRIAKESSSIYHQPVVIKL